MRQCPFCGEDCLDDNFIGEMCLDCADRVGAGIYFILSSGSK